MLDFQELSCVEFFAGRSTLVNGFRCRGGLAHLDLLGCTPKGHHQKLVTIIISSSTTIFKPNFG